MEHAVFFEISMVIIVATLCATIAKFTKQPVIPAYIFAGVILGPFILNILGDGELLESLSTFGIAFLLFLVGVELDIRKLIKTSRISILLGFVQMSFSVFVGYGFLRLFNFSGTSAWFLAFALGFSSTIVVMKLLGEQKELDTLYGQIIVGGMLVQDFIAIGFLIVFSVVDGQSGGGDLMAAIVLSILKGAFLICLAFVASRLLLSVLFKFFAKSTELLFLGSIAWCLVFALIAESLGFSIELGAFLAGLSISLLPYSIEISYRIKSLRDFFLPIFFAVLGGQLAFDGGWEMVWPTIALSTFVMVGPPVVVIALMIWRGYRSRTSFYTGTALAQVSEFSFIVMALAAAGGYVSHDEVSLVVLIGLVTMTVSSYFIEYKEKIYPHFRRFIKPFEKSSAAQDLEFVPDNLEKHIVLFGHHTMGYKIRQLLEKRGKEVLVVDNNPDVVQKLADMNVPHLYGSIGDEEILEKAQLSTASAIISTVPSARGTKALMQFLHEHDMRRKKSIVTAFHVDDALEFYDLGASYVMYPTSISADFVTDLLDNKIGDHKKNHIAELKQIHAFEEAR